MNEFYIIALTHILALISPGPDTIITIKNAIISRKNGILTSFGIGIGNLFHITASMLGLGLLISQSVVLYSIIKYICGAYLIYLGYKAFKSTSHFDLDEEITDLKKQKAKNSIFEGMLNSILNPKVTLFYFALFSQVVSLHTTGETKMFYALYLFTATVIYFSILSAILNIKPVRNALQKVFGYVEKVTGAVLVFLGIKVILEK
jgi:RhtB (resistance to homoserine/threonine) family protein